MGYLSTNIIQIWAVVSALFSVVFSFAHEKDLKLGHCLDIDDMALHQENLFTSKYLIDYSVF